MKIETIELSVPQRRLMEIFAKDLNEGDFGDKRIRLLLEYLRELLADEKMPSDTLCRMLDGTLPDLDFYKFYTAHMCNIVDYAKARCEKEKPFEESSFPSRALPFPNLFEPP